MASPLQLSEYDVIICGGGTAGCVLANRLSEDPSLTILMLEAGENANDDPRISTPGLFVLLEDDPERDWMFMSEPEPGLRGRRMPHPRGKCLGGSSAINLMALIYPSRASIDAWAALGNSGWGWDDLSPYYRKITRRYPPPEEVREALNLPPFDEKVRNPEGHIASSFPPTVDPLTKAWVETWKNLGQSWEGYPLEAGHAGGYIAAAAVDPDTATRSHSGVGYYAPASKRTNLHLVTGAMIDKVELNTSSPDAVVATGVTFSHSGLSYTVKARREVILTAGAFGSPAILERSGIGSRSLCEQLGIPNVIENPYVGENLQDHIMCQLTYEVKDGIPTADMMRDPEVAQKVMEMYTTSKKGPLANGAGYCLANEPLVEFITPLAKGELKSLLDKYLPDDSEATFPAEKRHYAFSRSVLESPNEAGASNCAGAFQLNGAGLTSTDKFAFTYEGSYLTIIPALSHPFSRGSVHIHSADSHVYPKILFNYFKHPLDLEILARYMMQSEVLAATAPFSDLLKPNGRRIPPGKDASTVENAIDLIKTAATSNYHPCGTCAMMPEELGGVVDSRLRVYGVKGLRVCDASIFPIQVRGNIQTTVYASAEKCSDILKEDLK